MSNNTVKLGTNNLTSEALVEKGDNHVVMCTGLAWLTLPAGYLTGLETLCAELKALDQEVLFNGGKLKFEAKRAKEVSVRANIKGLAGYVQAQSGGDLAKILATGFEVRSKGVPVEFLSMPEKLATVFTGVTGEAGLRWEKVQNAINYKVEVNTGNPFEEKDWVVVGYTSRAKYTLTGLESGKFCNFRVQAQGRKGLKSQVSQVVRGLAA